jgi:hypothetical protein
VFHRSQNAAALVTRALRTNADAFPVVRITVQSTKRSTLPGRLVITIPQFAGASSARWSRRHLPEVRS